MNASENMKNLPLKTTSIALACIPWNEKRSKKKEKTLTFSVQNRKKVARKTHNTQTKRCKITNTFKKYHLG